jgi:protein-tyrosine phosphatase
MAEGLLRDLLRTRGIDATVASAGLLPGGRPATADGIDVLAARGIDISTHVSRRLDDPAVGLADADLVVTMERRHLQEAVVLAPAVRSRAFTLVDLVRRAEAKDPRRPHESIADWAERLAAGRAHADILGVGDDKVDDPIGRSLDAYEDTADLLADLLQRLVARAWPSVVEGAA